MDPLETLGNEHGLIRHYLENLALGARAIEDGQRPSRAFFDKVVEFARTFTDGYHHFKEEHVLFVQLAQKRGGEVDAGLDVLRYEHERGRELVATIAGALDGYAAGDPRQTTALLESCAAYGSLVRHHIHTEDHVFYPMVRAELAAGELADIGEHFEKEREQHGGAAFEQAHKLVVDMGSIMLHLRPVPAVGSA